MLLDLKMNLDTEPEKGKNNETSSSDLSIRRVVLCYRVTFETVNAKIRDYRPRASEIYYLKYVSFDL